MARERSTHAHRVNANRAEGGFSRVESKDWSRQTRNSIAEEIFSFICLFISFSFEKSKIDSA
jgi:hypothetical protein